MSLVPIAQVSIAVTWTTTLLLPGSTLVLYAYAQSLRKDWRVRCARRARWRCQLNIIPRRPLSQQITPASTTLISPADMCTMTQAAGTSCMRKSHPSLSQKILSHSWQGEYVLPISTQRSGCPDPHYARYMGTQNAYSVCLLSAPRCEVPDTFILCFQTLPGVRMSVAWCALISLRM